MFNSQQIEKAMPKQTFELFDEGFSELEEIGKWTLVGGTALSIHYHHRLSEDLDFFIKHSTLEQSRKTIFSLMQKLEEQGFEVVKIKEDERNLDFEIFGVKVTFFASGLHNLKENCEKYKHIEIASIETITAMKIDAIINYRTKSRDFFDIYTISKNANISLFSMLDIYNKESHVKTKENEILHRFIDKKLDSNDEGLSAMKPQQKMSFSELRRWMVEQIKDNSREESKIINRLIESPSDIQKYTSMFFGFERMSLLQKFASISEPNMVLKCLEESIFDIGYKSIAGKNILDYYLDDNEMFRQILYYAKEIPEAWLNSRLYRSKEKMPLILLENSLINCIKNSSSMDRMETVASARGIDFQFFVEMVERKRRVLWK